MDGLLINNQRRNSIITSILSIIIGAIIILMAIFCFDVLVDIFFTCIGIGIIFVNIFPLIIASQAVANDKRYVFDLVFSIISIVLGILFIFNHGQALTIIFAIYLVILPIVRICMANNKMERFKKELPLFIIAILMLFNIFGAILRVALIAIGGLIVILGIVNIILTLINNKKDNNDVDNNNDKSDTIIIDAEIKDL